MGNSKGLNRDFYLISEAYTKKLSETAMTHSPSQLSVPKPCEPCAGSDEAEEDMGVAGCGCGSSNCNCGASGGNEKDRLIKKLSDINSLVGAIIAVLDTRDNINPEAENIIDDAYATLDKMIGIIAGSSDETEPETKGSYTASYITLGGIPYKSKDDYSDDMGDEGN